MTVHTDEGVDAAAVKQWLQSKQALKALDLSDQGIAASAGPIADSLAADKQASMTPKLLLLWGQTQIGLPV